MNNQAKVELMYRREKKSGLLVLLLWLLFGGVGLQFLYIRAYKTFFLSLVFLVVSSTMGGTMVSLFYLWVFFSGIVSAVLYGQVNKRIKEDCEILYGE